MSHKDEILAKAQAVPAIPTAAIKAIQLLQDIEIDIAELLKTIEYDPGLTSNVLRLANSAYFGGRTTISSLRDAVVRLGMKRILQLVMMSAISPYARRAIKGYDLPPGQLLEHSIATAIAAEQLAKALKVQAPDHTFTGALLHDLGKIVLGTFVEVDATPIRELAFEHQVSFELAEQRILGIDHAEVGAVLLEHWNLPANLVNPVRYHHQPEQAEGDTLVVDLVHVANMLALESGIGIGVAGLNYCPSEEVVARLGLRVEMTEVAVCEMLTALQELRTLVGADDWR